MSEKDLIFLAAEKDMGLRASLVETLKGMGLTQVLPAVSGDQAWSLLESHAPHFILSGLNLGDITGLTLLKLVRAHRQFTQTPFVLINEIMTKEQALEAVAAGVSDLMRRPLNPQRLQERIHALLNQAYDTQELQVRRLYQEGLALMRKGAWEKALPAFNAVVGVQESPQAHFLLGHILTQLGRPREAAVSLARAVRMDHSFRRAAQKLGEALLALGLDQEAQPHLERAVELFLAQAQDPQSPLSVFKEPWQPGSDYFGVFDSLGIAYRRAGRYAEAIELYGKAMQVNPQDGNPHHHVGRAHYETGNYDEALKSLKKAVDLSPGLNEAQKLLKIVAAKVAAKR